MFQRHKVFYEVGGVGAEGQDPSWKLQELLDWPVAVGCANHDVQNALKWSLMPLSQGDVLHQLYV
eukprot:2739392-Alexandrium_andersonii.AAC.1